MTEKNNMKTYYITTRKFTTFNNSGDKAHEMVIQSAADHRECYDKIDLLQQDFSKDLELHHKNLLPATGDDKPQSQKWHCRVLQKNITGRKDKPTNAHYHADFLRQNNLVEDIINTLDAKKYSDSIMLNYIEKYWINFIITNQLKHKLTAISKFHELIE